MKNTPDQSHSDDSALEKFLDRAAEALGTGEKKPLTPSAPPHRRLDVQVSSDRMEARLAAVFPDTTPEEILDALKQARVISGIQQKALKEALHRARKTGRHQSNIPAARGKPAVYRKRKEISYPFLKTLKDPETGRPLHVASSVFREIVEVMGRASIEKIRGYGRPVVVATPGEVLMRVSGEDEIEPGADVFGKPVRAVKDPGPSPLRAGHGVDLREDGSVFASRFGYISISGNYLSVVSPVWISSDRMDAYFVNPPQLGERRVPGIEETLKALGEQDVCFGIDRDAISRMCLDLQHGALRESCVRIARGQPPKLSKDQFWFPRDPLLPARFEAVRNALQAAALEYAVECATPVQAVRAGAVLAEQATDGTDSAPGKDLFNNPVAPPEPVQARKLYKAGVNVRREVADGVVRYVSDVYGYFGISENRITVVSPLWLSPDRMAAYFIALPQDDPVVLPTVPELLALLEQMRIRHGVDEAALEQLGLDLPETEDPESRAIVLARGTPPEPGDDGAVELHFSRLPDPGRFLEDDRMDFRERNAVPQVHPGELLAKRTFPTPGTPGTDVRGRALQPPKGARELLYAGPSVTMEERGGIQYFYATGSGWARVVKDTLSVQQRFRHRGDLDYKVGNLKMEGDVELEGTVKSRFKVEATGDVYVGGTVEKNAEIIAGGNILVRGGIIGATIRAKGDIFARFIQDADVEAGGNLLVRNYLQDSQVHIGQKATVQGNEGGERQLCLLGGTLVAGQGVEAVSIGAAYGRPTRVTAGLDEEAEVRLERYRKGLSFAGQRIRQAARALGATTAGVLNKDDLMTTINKASPGHRKFLAQRLKELNTLQELKRSLEHHVTELNAGRAELARRATIRVPGTVFSKVTIQVGDFHITSVEKIQAVTFCLNRGATQVSREPLSRA